VCALTSLAGLMGCTKPTSRVQVGNKKSGPEGGVRADDDRTTRHPRGTIRGTVRVVGERPLTTSIALPEAFKSARGCREAAVSYAYAFDRIPPGPMPYAVVFVKDVSETDKYGPREVRLNFLDCQILPRYLFVRPHDKVKFHALSQMPIVSHVPLPGNMIDRAVMMGAPEVEYEFPIGETVISARNLPPSVQAHVVSTNNLREVTTDDQGQYELVDVEEGPREVSVWYPGTKETHNTVVVKANEVVELNFELQTITPQPGSVQPPVLPDSDASVPTATGDGGTRPQAPITDAGYPVPQ